MGFTVCIMLFRHSVPNKNDSDVGIFSGHQVLFSESTDIPQLFFFFVDRRRRSMWAEGGRRTGRLISPTLPFKKAKKLFK